jgi:hypothetical protein
MQRHSFNFTGVEVEGRELGAPKPPTRWHPRRAPPKAESQSTSKRLPTGFDRELDIAQQQQHQPFQKKDFLYARGKKIRRFPAAVDRRNTTSMAHMRSCDRRMNTRPIALIWPRIRRSGRRLDGVLLA